MEMREKKKDIVTKQKLKTKIDVNLDELKDIIYIRNLWKQAETKSDNIENPQDMLRSQGKKRKRGKARKLSRKKFHSKKRMSVLLATTSIHQSNRYVDE